MFQLLPNHLKLHQIQKSMPFSLNIFTVVVDDWSGKLPFLLPPYSHLQNMYIILGSKDFKYRSKITHFVPANDKSVSNRKQNDGLITYPLPFSEQPPAQ